jgi:hypothetical protein
MLRFSVGERLYIGPMLKGQAALDVYGRVYPVLVDAGIATAMDPVPTIEADARARALMARPSGEAVALATLAEWTVDERPITAASLGSLYGSVEGRRELADACVRVWSLHGFFGGSTKALVERLIQEATPTPESA